RLARHLSLPLCVLVVVRQRLLVPGVRDATLVESRFAAGLGARFALCGFPVVIELSAVLVVMLTIALRRASFAVRIHGTHLRRFGLQYGLALLALIHRFAPSRTMQDDLTPCRTVAALRNAHHLTSYWRPSSNPG